MMLLDRCMQCQHTYVYDHKSVKLKHISRDIIWKYFDVKKIHSKGILDFQRIEIFYKPGVCTVSTCLFMHCHHIISFKGDRTTVGEFVPSKNVFYLICP